MNSVGSTPNCANPHGWTVAMNQQCIVSEGFANFFAGATHWSDSSTTPPLFAGAYFNLEGDSKLEGTACETSINGDPEEFEANAARFFWDLFDSTNIDETASGSCDYATQCGWCDGYDNTNRSLSQLVLDWDLPEGTGNGYNNESDGDNDARNSWDFWRSNTFSCEELFLNCLDPHDRYY